MADVIELNISGMTCNHCVAAVSQALAAVDGVEQVVEVALEGGSARVQGSATPQALIAAVEEAGYRASVR